MCFVLFCFALFRFVLFRFVSFRFVLFRLVHHHHLSRHPMHHTLALTQVLLADPLLTPRIIQHVGLLPVLDWSKLMFVTPKA